MQKINPLADDLDHILTHTRDLWEGLRGQRIFITGGTGFFGCWLLESFAWANEKLNLKAEALVLTRNYEGFLKKAPHLATHGAIKFHIGDIQTFEFPDGSFPTLIHGAVYTSPEKGKGSPLLMANELLLGSKRVLDFCIQTKVKRVLFISTGAVYGPTPPGGSNIPEDFPGSFDPTMRTKVYHQIRRMMESWHVLYAEEKGFEVKIARCFSFLGPYLPLNGRFAVGDFIGDVLLGNPVAVRGNGKPVRSYLYAADLAIWLWTILFKGESGRPYNVGSEIPTTILNLAGKMASAADPPLKVQVSGERLSGEAPDHYLPDTTRAQTELGLNQVITLESAIRKTLHWHKGLA